MQLVVTMQSNKAGKMTGLAGILRDESGATAIEYGLIVALIAIAAIASLQALGTELSATMNTVDTTLGAANTP